LRVVLDCIFYIFVYYCWLNTMGMSHLETQIPLKNFHNFCVICPFHSFHIPTCMACPWGGKGGGGGREQKRDWEREVFCLVMLTVAETMWYQCRWMKYEGSSKGHVTACMHMMIWHGLVGCLDPFGVLHWVQTCFVAQ
jgi:hypothetical protein